MPFFNCFAEDDGFEAGESAFLRFFLEAVGAACDADESIVKPSKSTSASGWFFLFRLLFLFNVLESLDEPFVAFCVVASGSSAGKGL